MILQFVFSFLLNPIIHTWLRDSCFTCDVHVSPVHFNICMVIYPYTRVLFQMGEGYTGGDDCMLWLHRVFLVTHSADSVTTQSIAFKYVMASELYRYT